MGKNKKGNGFNTLDIGQFNSRRPKNYELDKKHTGHKNNLIFWHYYDLFKRVAVNIFKWNGLPEEIDERFVELQLFERGELAFFYDEIIEQYVMLPIAANFQLDIYQNKVSWTAYSVNGYQRNLNKTNSVLVYSNFLRDTPHMACMLFAERIAEVTRTIDINMNAMKTPILITCDENAKLTLKNLYYEYDSGKPIIYGMKGLDIEAFQVLKTDAPYLCDKLMDLKNWYISEGLTYLGLDNNMIDKKERLVSTEAEANQDFVQMMREQGLHARMQACELINEKFGLNISVEARDFIRDSRDDQNPNDTIDDNRLVDSGGSKGTESNTGGNT